MRFAAFGATAAMGLWIVKPAAFFDENGKPYEFGQPTVADPKTYVTWWVFSGVIATASILFI